MDDAAKTPGNVRAIQSIFALGYVWLGMVALVSAFVLFSDMLDGRKNLNTFCRWHANLNQATDPESNEFKVKVLLIKNGFAMEQWGKFARQSLRTFIYQCTRCGSFAVRSSKKGANSASTARSSCLRVVTPSLPWTKRRSKKSALVFYILETSHQALHPWILFIILSSCLGQKTRKTTHVASIS